MRTQSKTLVLGALLALAAACSFSVSTANLSSLKLSKDKTAAQETAAFAPTDTIYAVATVANSISKVGVKAQFVVEAVDGQPTGPVQALETTINLDSSGTATFTFTPPANGWPAGKYKIDVVMLDESGTQKDQKTASFSVS